MTESAVPISMNGMVFGLCNACSRPHSPAQRRSSSHVQVASADVRLSHLLLDVGLFRAVSILMSCCLTRIICFFHFCLIADPAGKACIVVRQCDIEDTPVVDHHEHC